MLVLGYLLGRQTGEDRVRGEHMPRPPGPEAVVVSKSHAAGVETRDAAASVDTGTAKHAVVPPRERPDRAIYLPAAWHDERFVHWYRSHAATCEFSRRSPELLRSFGAAVVEQLGRIPRREILDALIEVYAPLHEATAEVEAALSAGEIARHEVEARLAPARRHFSDGIYRTLAYSDYLYLTREWVDHKNPYRPFRHERSPQTPRPMGGDPLQIPLRRVEDFGAWYRAYRHDLELPARDHDFLDLFFRDIVMPLGRVPPPKLMRSLQKLYAAYRNEAADGEFDGRAVRDLFRGLRSALEPLDYDRIRWWENWSEPLQELGLMAGD